MHAYFSRTLHACRFFTTTWSINVDYKKTVVKKDRTCVCREVAYVFSFSSYTHANMVVIYKITVLLFACMIYEGMF